MNAAKVLVIGWDGATFDRIRPLAAQGRMPVMSRLLAQGVSAPLNSTTPAVTPVAWSTFMTGVNPGKHGVFDAFRFDAASRSLHMVHAGMRAAPAIWSLLDAAGRPAGAVNIPLTYPPDRLRHGFVLSGMFTPGAVADMAHPPELKTELEAALGPLTLEPDMHEDPAVYLGQLLANIERQERITLHCLRHKAWDYLASVFIESDRVQHCFWRYSDPADPRHAELGDAMNAVYAALDAALGRILAAAPEGTRLCMVSDHGAGPLRRTVFLNKWLLDQGFLALKGEFAALLSRRPRPAKPSPLAGLLKRILPESLVNRIRQAKAKQRQDRRNLFLQAIDWDRTVAFSEGVSGGIHLNPLAAGFDREQTLRRLEEGLPTVTDPSTGTRVFTAIRRREDLFQGEAAAHAPDLFVECAAGYQVIVPNEVLFFGEAYDGGLFLGHKWSGRHEQLGVFLLHGPGVRQGLALDMVEMADVTPTLLHLLGEPLPAHLDGRPRLECLERAGEVNHGDAALPGQDGRDLSPEEEAEIARRLQDLGYL